MSRRHLILALERDMSLGRGVIQGVARRLHGRNDWVVQPVWPIDPASVTDGPGPRPDAVLGRITPEFADALPADGGPVLVNVSRGNHARRAAHVTCDDDAIGRLAGQYLLGQGMRHFALCGRADKPTHWGRRAQAFAEAVGHADRPLPLLPTRCGAAELAEALGRLPRPCGVLAFNDLEATDLIRHCHETGVSVPGDVAVLGVDDNTFASVFSPVPISSVAVDFERIGYEAMGVLDRIVEHDDWPEAPIRIPPTRIVERHSTDFPGQVDGLAVAAAREIRLRACEPITLTTIVEALPATYRTIDRHFRKAFGRSMGEELVRSRINEAARLLAETHLPLRLVADRVGYASTAYFANTFSKHTGTPPGAYRKAHHRREHG